MTPSKPMLSLCICGDAKCKIPYGLCHCGCGRKTNLATQNHRKYKHKKGQPLKCVSGHSGIAIGKPRGPIRHGILEGGDVTYIPLPNKLEAIIDSSEIEKCKGLWHANACGYAVRFDMDKGVQVVMHRIIIEAPDDKWVDHINGDRLDNRKTNLRLVSASQNAMNRKKFRTNKSGVTGVSWTQNRWIVDITVNRLRIPLGRFKKENLDQAIAARRDAEKKYYGEYARCE